jgi:hypothetical protein
MNPPVFRLVQNDVYSFAVLKPVQFRHGLNCTGYKMIFLHLLFVPVFTYPVQQQKQRIRTKISGGVRRPGQTRRKAAREAILPEMEPTL